MGTSRSRRGRWWRVADAVTITPLRLAWLQKLGADGPTEEADMPLRAGGGLAGVGVWGALRDAGFIEVGLPGGARLGCKFTLTDTGRAVLAKALRVAANQGTPVDAEWPATKGENDA